MKQTVMAMIRCSRLRSAFHSSLELAWANAPLISVLLFTPWSADRSEILFYKKFHLAKTKKTKISVSFLVDVGLSCQLRRQPSNAP